MTVQELLAKHSVENAELRAELEGLLATAESKNADGIPYARFKEKVDEVKSLKADLAEKESELEGYKSNIEKDKAEIERLKGIESEHQKVIEAKNQKNAELWESRKKAFEVDESDPFFEKIDKIKYKFQFGEELKPEQIEVNNNLYDTYDEIGYFKKQTPEIENDKQPKGGNQKYPTPFD